MIVKKLQFYTMVVTLSMFAVFSAFGEEYGKGYDVYTTAGAVAVQSDNVLLACWPGGANKEDRALWAIDIGDPSEPRLLDRLSIDGFPQGLAVGGEYVYVVNGRDMLVVDTANPESLDIISRFRVDDDPVRGPQGVALRGDTAWLACRRGGIRGIDVSDLENPELIGSAEVDAFVGEVAIVDGILYAAADTRGVYVFDIEDPFAPQQLDRMPAPRGNLGRMQVLEDVAYLAAGNLLTVSLSLENPVEPEWIGYTEDRHVYSPYFGSYACDLDVGNVTCSETGELILLAVVADSEGGLIATDLSRPDDPAFLGALKGGGGPDVATGVVLLEGMAYVTDESYGLRVVDVSDPRNPKPVGTGLGFKE